MLGGAPGTADIVGRDAADQPARQAAHDEDDGQAPASNLGQISGVGAARRARR